MAVTPPLPGPIALVGSGEYLPQMEEIDSLLLAGVGGSAARVVILATAAGREEPSSPARWTQAGRDHFARLGVQVEPAGILTRADAGDPRWLPLLEAADFFYFSGGSPGHVVETLAGSPAWEVIRRRHAGGAVLAGCSAGAMAFGGYIAGPRALLSMAAAIPWPAALRRRAPGIGGWHPALGLLPRLIVLPHFDRLTKTVSRRMLARAARAIPAGVTLIGVDEDTALLRLAPSLPSRWQVRGRGTVSVFTGESTDVAVHRSGEHLALHT